MNTVLGLAFFALLLCFLEGCGWDRKMIFPSPSQRASIEVWQRSLANSSGTQVELVTAQRRVILATITREAYIYFVHVYWAPDETKVGVLATGFNHCQVAYDLKLDRAIDFAEIQKGMAQSIEETCHIPAATDPIAWAFSAEAPSPFFKLHPEIKLSYH